MKKQASTETIILIHGLWMTGIELRWLGRRFESCGCKVRYYRYSSWAGTLAAAAEGLRRMVAEEGGRKVHLVGHSLGGIVIARMLEGGDIPNRGRIALLASPQLGSRLAASLERFLIGKFILGRVACEGIVHSRPASLSGKELLVIAGTLPLGFAWLFGVDRPNDGTVAVVETEVYGAKRILVAASHMGVLFSSRVFSAIQAFLNH